ncbi:MAG: hypothetical protein JW924_11920 [Fusobacteriaceae bacterium]|nr:hypothetical protein [Fusobacteriaceae bacterium]
MDNTILTEERKKLVAGVFPIVTQTVTVKSGAKLLKDSLVSIDSVSKKAVLASNAQKDYFGILTAEVDATTTDKEATVMVTGEFFEEGIIVTEDHVIDKMVARNKTLFIK